MRSHSEIGLTDISAFRRDINSASQGPCHSHWLERVSPAIRSLSLKVKTAFIHIAAMVLIHLPQTSLGVLSFHRWSDLRQSLVS
jgi:hypothetical protein